MKRVMLLLVCSSLFGEAPWGKEADVPSKQPIAKETIATRMIRFHKEVISPADGPRSHYHPNSSQYTKNSILKYGFFRGVMLGCDRLMRENDDPWIYPMRRMTDPKRQIYNEYLKLDPVK